MKATLPIRWAVTRLDVHLLIVVIATIAVFYRIEALLGEVVPSVAFGLIPGVMWLLGAKFVATRRNTRGPESIPSKSDDASAASGE